MKFSLSCVAFQKHQLLFCWLSQLFWENLIAASVDEQTRALGVRYLASVLQRRLLPVAGWQSSFTVKATVT